MSGCQALVEMGAGQGRKGFGIKLEEGTVLGWAKEGGDGNLVFIAGGAEQLP